MKKLLMLLLCLSFTAQAVELEGVRLEDNVHLGSSNLVLNGVGVRSRFIFDIYVAALYLGAKKSSADEVLADAGEKRLALYLLRDISGENLLYAFKRGFENNHTYDELMVMKLAMHNFELIFHKMGKLKEGDIILMDYQRDVGTQVKLNGVLRGTSPGAEFNTALLQIWLGGKPAQEALKLKLLGGQ